MESMIDNIIDYLYTLYKRGYSLRDIENMLYSNEELSEYEIKKIMDLLKMVIEFHNSMLN